MAKTLARLELVIRDLAHELRTHRHPLGVLVLPARPSADATRHAPRAVRIPLALRHVHLERFQLGDQLLALGGAEGRCVTYVVERLPAILPQPQRTNRLPSVSLPPAHDPPIHCALLPYLPPNP